MSESTKTLLIGCLKNEMKESKIGFIAKFKISDKVLIHRCSNNTVGLCEFIGWKETEE